MKRKCLVGKKRKINLVKQYSSSWLSCLTTARNSVCGLQLLSQDYLQRELN